MTFEDKVSETSVMTAIKLNNDDCLPPHGTNEKVDRPTLLENASVPTTEHENFYPQTHVLAFPGGFDRDSGTGKEVSTILEVNLGKDEEIHVDIDNAGSAIYQGKDEDFCLVSCGTEKDQSRDRDTSILATDKKNQGEDKESNINTVFSDVEKDLGKRKDLRAVLTVVKNDHRRDEDICTVVDDVENVHDKDKDVRTVLVGVEEDPGKDEDSNQSKTVNQDGQTAESDCLLLEPPEEFRVCSSYLCLFSFLLDITNISSL